MHGDFSRDTFDAARHFRRVLMQQGRVQLDADWNEQTAILLHYLQALAADLIGPYGGPEGGTGFGIVDAATLTANERERLTKANVLPLPAGDFLLGRGRYYINGLLCENDDYVRYGTQAGYPAPEGEQPDDLRGRYLVYLDVWERHLTYLELESADGSVISPREVALGGPDTATRTQLVCQVRLAAKTPDDRSDIPAARDEVLQLWPEWIDRWQPANRGLLRAWAIKATTEPDSPCITPPESRYRGAENQLYRVEIHRGGSADGGATFKWSRENGSVIFPVRKIAANTITLETMGRDARMGLDVGDWLELIDDDYTLQGRAESLLEITAIDYESNLVTFAGAPDSTVGQNLQRHPLVRRWDQREGDRSDATSAGVPIREGDPIDLEDGIQVQFEPGGNYRSGDYWLIPARTASGDVEWPGTANTPEARRPHGITHSYAPLWIITVGAGGAVTAAPADDLRRSFKPIQ